MQENKPAPPHARGKATILIVDDSPTIRKLVSMTLESRGYTVVVACDGVDGLAKMQEGLPNLILSDITMPRLDGYQFCKVVKSNKETKHIPVIMLSGNDGLFDKVRGRMAGSANYITKPFEPNNLVKEIEKFVKATRPAQPAPAAARQPATAQGPPPASQAKGNSPIDRPIDPVAAKQLSRKLSGIYIPQASTGSSAKAAQHQPAASSAGGKDAQPASSATVPQAAARRPSPKHNDEPEIKIFYNSDAPAAAPAVSASEAVRQPQPAQQRPHQEKPQAFQAPPQQKNMPGQFSAGQTRPAAPAADKTAPSVPAAARPAQPAVQPQTNSLKATCAGCGTIYANIKPEHVGKYARCKKCGTRFLITA